MPQTVYRASLLHCLDDPAGGADNAVEYFEDGALLVEGQHILEAGPAAKLLDSLSPDVQVVDYSGNLIVPGFIDTHVHYPQTDVIASHGTRLLEWLERYTFPTEQQFSDAGHAQQVADFFLDELLRNGTTTALVFATVHPASVDAIFEAAGKRNMRLAAGKVLMDRNCPEYLRDTPESAYSDSKALIERWHGQDRLLYAITPRFAPTSTDAQLQQAGKLAREHPDVFVHTHVAENIEEVEWAARLFPWSRSYLDIYEKFELLRNRAMYAHCIHLDDLDRQRMAATASAMCFCPTSNLFLGSGLFDLDAAASAGVRVGIGTDIGGGTSFSLLRTLSEGYKVAQLKGQELSPLRALYLATLGGARAMELDTHIGNFMPNREADFIVLDWHSTPLISRRMQNAKHLDERLFALLMLGDDRAVSATYVAGQCLHEQP